MKATLPLLVGLLLIPGFGFSQATDASAGKTIEEKKLQSGVALQVISGLVADNTRDAKIRALQLLDKMTVSADDAEMVSLVVELGTEGTTKQVYQNRRLINDFPDVRRKAAEILGKIGGDSAREALLAMAQRDNEPMVIAEAVYNLGEIGGDETQRNRISQVIAHLVTVQDPQAPDNSLGFSATHALESLINKSNGKVSPEIFQALITISNGNYVSAVSAGARKVIYDHAGFTNASATPAPAAK